MAYNLTGLVSNSTGMLGFTRGVSDILLFGWGGALILIGISAIIFTSVMFTSNDLNKALITTSFIAFSLSLPLRALGLLPNLGIFMSIIILAIVLAVTWRRD